MEVIKLGKDEQLPYDLLLSADPSKDLVEDYIHRGTCYVLKDEDSVLGEFVLLKTGQETMEIMNLAVVKNRVGKGLGRMLVEKCIELAREADMQILEISTGNSSIGQLALYQKCGFRIVGVEPDYFTRNYKEDIVENGIKCQDIIRLEIRL